MVPGFRQTKKKKKKKNTLNRLNSDVLGEENISLKPLTQR